MPRTPVHFQSGPADAEATEATSAVVSQTAGAISSPQLTPSQEDATILDALLDQLAEQQDPWSYVQEIEDRRIDMNHRMTYYPAFITLVSQRPQAEQDALLARGQPVFRYRMDTARDDIEALRQEGTGALVRIRPSIVTDDFLAEVIKQGHHARYLVYRRDTQTTGIVERVQVGDVQYFPPQSQLLDTGTILLPTGIEEYGDHVALYQDVRHFLRSYVHLDDSNFANMCAHYVLLSWVFDRFDVVPYLRAIGDFEVGKTRLIHTVGQVCYRPIIAGGATTASPIFRIIDRFKGTLVLDEADFSDSDLYSEVVKILNQGYTSNNPVLRSERGEDKDFDVRAYDCFSPKILATRKRFSDPALESRCLTYTMLPVLPADMDPRIPWFFDQEFRDLALALRNKLLLWRFRTWHSATVNPRERIPGLGARLNQVLLPMLSCSDNEQMRRSILTLAMRHQSTLREDRRESFNGKVAFCLLDRYKHRRAGDATILLKEVVERLKMELGESVKIDSRSVGAIVRNTFKIDTVYRGGNTWIAMTDTDRDRLSSNYSLPVESFTRHPVGNV